MFSLQNRKGYEDNTRWINSDLNYDDIRYFMKNDIEAETSMSMSEFEYFFSEENIKKSKIIIDIMWKIRPVVTRYATKGDYVVLDLRNFEVITDVVSKFSYVDTISVIYGEKHLSHFVKQLKKLNFKVIEKTYLDSSK